MHLKVCDDVNLCACACVQCACVCILTLCYPVQHARFERRNTFQRVVFLRESLDQHRKGAAAIVVPSSVREPLEGFMRAS